MWWWTWREGINRPCRAPREREGAALAQIPARVLAQLVVAARHSQPSHEPTVTSTLLWVQCASLPDQSVRAGQASSLHIAHAGPLRRVLDVLATHACRSPVRMSYAILVNLVLLAQLWRWRDPAPFRGRVPPGHHGEAGCLEKGRPALPGAYPEVLTTGSV